ncbi:MAG: hypothetical protein M3518_09460 [Actinomycetota bacterium]|nr:hypothetical protein [Actinomycetota bacterium]
MGSRLVIFAAVMALVVGIVGRVTYEQVVNTRTPALAQDEDPRKGEDCGDFRSQAEAQAALRQDPSDPDVLDEGEGPDDGIACETTEYDDPATDLTPVAAAVGNAGSASPTSTASPTPTTTSSPSPNSPPPTTTNSPPDDASASPEPRPPKNEDLMKSGGPAHGPVLTMPDGTCLREYPIKRNGYCYR